MTTSSTGAPRAHPNECSARGARVFHGEGVLVRRTGGKGWQGAAVARRQKEAFVDPDRGEVLAGGETEAP
jgi:hypothetical protein